MKYFFLQTLCFLFAGAVCAQQGGRTAFEKMYRAYSGKWYHTFTFTQTTDMYRNDTLIKTETWYEAIRFPADFRIDFGEADSGNAVIFKNDSSYVFRRGQKIRTTYYPNDLLFLLGGMYFYPPDESFSRLRSFGFDPDKFCETEWKGQPVYVFGASHEGERTSQVWFDKKNYSLVRMLKYENGHKEEALLEKHVRLEKGFSETLVYFYINDRLVQAETYHDLKADVDIDPAVFDVQHFIKRKKQDL